MWRLLEPKYESHPDGKQTSTCEQGQELRPGKYTRRCVLPIHEITDTTQKLTVTILVTGWL